MFKEDEYWAETFSEIDLKTSQISSIEFDDCTFNACDLSNAKFSQCRFIDCRFINCDMNLINFSGSRFEESFFRGCKVTGVDWTLLDYSEFIKEAPFSFYETVLDYSSFFGVTLENLSLNKCRIIEVDFREATLGNADFSESDLAESQFRHTNLEKADFRGAINYNIDLRINTINGAKFSRDEAVNLLASLDIVVE